jgi:hypothetical protein
MRFTAGNGKIVYDELSYATYANRCHKCNRIAFKFGGKLYAWVDGCKCNDFITSYILVNG